MAKLGKNSFIGIGLIAIAIVLTFLVNSFGIQIAQSETGICGMTPDECPHAKNIPVEVVIGYILSSLLFIIGTYLIIGDFRKVKIGKKEAEGWKRIISALGGDEKLVYELIASKDGVMFQSNIVEESELPKVKVSRVLDRLEARNLLERRRRGMSNVVVLKNKYND